VTTAASCLRSCGRTLGVLLILCLGACGRVGGGVSSGAGGPLATGPNVTSVSVNAGPAGIINGAFVSVTVCAPATANCQTVDNVLVDTASSGLRLLAEALPAGFALPQAADVAGDPLYECVQFGDGYAWGSVRTADVTLTSEEASSLPVHLIGDPAAPAVPANCPNGTPPENTVQSFGANGVLGISVFREDCGSACASAVVPATYYGCPAAGCQGVMLPLSQQLQNPVAHFAIDNNGVILQLLSVDPAGAVGDRGALIFGIGTQSNNVLAAATLIALDATAGTFTTAYGAQTLPASIMDSGSNALYFPDASLPRCTSAVAIGFYCPTSVQNLRAVQTSATGVSNSVSFSVANAAALLQNQPTFTAFQNLGGIALQSNSFDWGLPFFYGRRVFVAIEGQNTAAGTGPFVAY
jgi:hypothetical protein